MNLRTSPGFWALTLGAVGGAAGFFGPIFLNPDANQGPMLGLFITGPGGAIAGAVLGFFFRILPFSDQIRTQVLMWCCTLLGLGTLWFALPEPVVKARIVDATIERCRPAGELIPASIVEWEDRIAQVSYAKPRDNWRDDTQRMLRDSPGVIVELHVARSNSILEHRRPWERGRLSAQGWKRIDDTQRYFGGGTCDSYPRGKHVILTPTSRSRPPVAGEGPRPWPPADLPNFLGLQVLEAVPASYQNLVTRS
jgi:hypothetical protein